MSLIFNEWTSEWTFQWLFSPFAATQHQLPAKCLPPSMWDGFHMCSEPRLVLRLVTHPWIHSPTHSHLSNKYFLSPWHAMYSSMLNAKIQYWIRQPPQGSYILMTSKLLLPSSLPLDPTCLYPVAVRDLWGDKAPQINIHLENGEVLLSLHVLTLAWHLWQYVQFLIMIDTIYWMVFHARHYAKCLFPWSHLILSIEVATISSPF